MTKPLPKSFGLFLYPGFEVLDVFGPLEALNVISRPEFGFVYKSPTGPPDYFDGITLSIISETGEAISPAWDQKLGSSLAQQFVAQYSISNAPDLDVLILPGGLGSNGVSDAVVDWVKQVFPGLQYLITVCTGSHIAAKAGVLDGLHATSNKSAWGTLSKKENTWAHKTYWVANARWVKGSDKVWTTSGVSAGTDGFLAWMREIYSVEVGRLCCTWMEYIVDECADNDPFSKGLSDLKPTM